jgi:hypothetical protein
VGEVVVAGAAITGWGLALRLGIAATRAGLALLAGGSGAAATASSTGRILIPEGDVLVGVVQRSGTLTLRSSGTSHAAVARSINALKANGQLIEGAAAVTVGKEGGRIWVLGSQNFGGPLGIPDWAIKMVKAAVE